MPDALNRRSFLVSGLLGLAALPLVGQIRDSALSDSEVEQVRDSRLNPSECVLLFVKFLDLRIQEIQDLYSKPRQPGREQDTHDLVVQFTSIADELSDNLDDYGSRRIDIRKALPKLVSATERWSSALKSPPENSTYDVARKIALESVNDLHDAAKQLSGEQAAWFKLHPPPKHPDTEIAPPIDLPH